MKYENPKIPEGINVSQEHPLKEFFFLVAAVSLALVVLFVSLSLLAEWFVRFIPFEMEQQLSKKVFFLNPVSKSPTAPVNVKNKNIEKFLQQLTDSLAAKQGLPDGMFITVHYVDNKVVNAFATLGGNIIIHRGLLEKLSSENALSMVLAHEIAHIKHRDPIIAMGRGITVGLALTSLAGLGEGDFAQQLIGNIGLITALSFSRDQEREADTEGLNTLSKYYGHVAGSQALFILFEKENAGEGPVEFLSTHPLVEDRLESIDRFRAEHLEKGRVKALPKIISDLKSN